MRTQSWSWCFNPFAICARCTFPALNSQLTYPILSLLTAHRNLSALASTLWAISRAIEHIAHILHGTFDEDSISEDREMAIQQTTVKQTNPVDRWHGSLIFDRQTLRLAAAVYFCKFHWITVRHSSRSTTSVEEVCLRSGEKYNCCDQKNGKNHLP